MIIQWKAVACGLAALPIALTLGSGRLAAADQTVVGFTSLGFFVPALAEARDGAIAKAAELGVKIEYITADDAPTQQRAVENLLAKQVNVLAIDPNDSEAISQAVLLANKTNVPVVMWVGGAKSGKVATTVVSDERQGGYDIARWTFQRMGGKGKVGLLQGDKAHQAGALREQGFREALKEFPNIQLAGYGEGKWARDVGERVATNMLTQAPDLNAIVALNDEMAHGALAAAQARGRAGDLIVTGYNGQCDAIKAVLDGTMAATLYQPFRDIGAKVVEVSVSAAKGETLPDKINMPALVLDKPLAQKVAGGTASDVSPGLVASAKAAAAGCK
jgi:ribose transport system substrate-binding protein